MDGPDAAARFPMEPDPTSTIEPYTAFARFYDGWAARMTEDVDFYVRRALEAGGTIVELGAGTGRISIPIAEAGRDVIAVDASEAMIDIGRKKAADAGVADRIRWERARMQDFVADPPVPLVVIPFRSFVHLTTTDDQRRALDNVARSLRPGGRLALNLFVPDPFLQVEHAGRRQEIGAFVDDRGRRCVMTAETSYEPATQEMTLRPACEVYEDGRVVERVTETLRARVVYRYEMEHLLARAGLEIEALYGWFDERPLTEECREMIWVARRP